jgi:hypothetical protein
MPFDASELPMACGMIAILVALASHAWNTR